MARRGLDRALAEEPSAFCARRRHIRMTERRVAVVDARHLHPRFLQVRALYLGGNRISELGWVRHLPSLQRLGLADNCVADVAELEHLGGPRDLESLALRGNPVEWAPFFTSHVRCAAGPGLRRLDGRAPPPLRRARAALREETAQLALLVDEYCTVLCLGMALRLCRVHAELCRKTVRYPSSSGRRLARANCAPTSWQMDPVADLQETPTSARVDRLLRIWAYADRLDPHQLSALRHDLLCAVVGTRTSTRHRLLSATGWERAAFSEVAAKLRSAAADLLVLCDEQRERDQRELRARPRIGPESATRRAAELEAERAWASAHSHERATRDLLGVIDVLRAPLHSPHAPPFAAAAAATPPTRGLPRLRTWTERSWEHSAQATRTSERLLQVMTPERLDLDLGL